MYEQILSLYNTGNYSRFNYVALIMIVLSKFAYNNIVKNNRFNKHHINAINNYTRIS